MLTFDLQIFIFACNAVCGSPKTKGHPEEKHNISNLIPKEETRHIQSLRHQKRRGNYASLSFILHFENNLTIVGGSSLADKWGNLENMTQIVDYPIRFKLTTLEI